jgi:uncharacterized membrane protein SirB2
MPRVTQRALLLLIGLWLLIKCAANPTNYSTTPWLTDKTPDDHATASWNSIVKKSRATVLFVKGLRL